MDESRDFDEYDPLKDMFEEERELPFPEDVPFSKEKLCYGAGPNDYWCPSHAIPAKDIDPKTGLRTDIEQETYTFKPMSPLLQKQILEKEFENAPATPLATMTKEKPVDTMDVLSISKTWASVVKEFSHFTEETADKASVDEALVMLFRGCTKADITFSERTLYVNGAKTKYSMSDVLKIGVTEIVARINKLF